MPNSAPWQGSMSPEPLPRDPTSIGSIRPAGRLAPLPEVTRQEPQRVHKRRAEDRLPTWRRPRPARRSVGAATGIVVSCRLQDRHDFLRHEFHGSARQCGINPFEAGIDDLAKGPDLFPQRLDLRRALFGSAVDNEVLHDLIQRHVVIWNLLVSLE